MKKLHFVSAVLAFAAFALTGCQKNDRRGNDAENGIPLTLTAANPDVGASRTVMTGDFGHLNFQTGWRASDQIGIFTADGMNGNIPFSIASISSEGLATFSGNIAPGTSQGTQALYAYYPFRPIYLVSGGPMPPSAMPCYVLGVQTMKGTSHDDMADYMYAEPSTLTYNGVDAVQGAHGLVFHYLVAFINLRLKIGAGADPLVTGTSKVYSVKITAAGKAVAGSFNLNIPAGSWTPTGTSESVTVNTDSNATPTIADMATNGAMIVVNPFTLNSGETMVVAVTIDGGTVTKTLTASGEGIAFNAGSVKTLDMILDASATVTP